MLTGYFLNQKKNVENAREIPKDFEQSLMKKILFKSAIRVIDIENT